MIYDDGLLDGGKSPQHLANAWTAATLWQSHHISRSTFARSRSDLRDTAVDNGSPSQYFARARTAGTA